jgi:predicted anti-sigma-YlaC factor YlaD
MAARARRLYERAQGYGMHGLEHFYPGFTEELATDPEAAAARVAPEDVPLLYWNAAALGLAISVSRGDAHMLAQLPEVEALLARALELDEAWEDGALHEFAIVLAGAGTGFDPGTVPALREHYERALELSGGTSAALFVTWAESVSVPMQDAVEFRAMLERALAIDPDDHEENRLMNLVSQRRARWLLGRIDDLFLDPEGTGQAGEEGR